MIRLEPVVELTPHDLGIENFLELHESGAWDSSWSSRLRPYALSPLSPGSWHIPLAAFTAAGAFDVLCEVRLRDTEGVEPSKLEQVAPLSGGYALLSVHDGATKVDIAPSCCCDLSDLVEWQSLTELSVGSSKRLLIGHGTYSACRTPHGLLIEEEPEHANHAPSRFVYDPGDFERAVAAARQIRDAFEQRLRSHLEGKAGLGAPTDIASVLVRGR